MLGLLFPGQGAQEVGMGRALAEAFPAARAAFDEANHALGYDLAHACFDGPADLLTQTDVCQPAILATSVAAWRVASEHGLRGDVVLGHSLGEFSALVACGSLPYAEALRMVAERGAAMHAAGEHRPGTMAALLGVDDERARALCAQAGEVWPANYNCPGQVVASGGVEAVDRLVELCADERVKATRLRVGGAFHSPLMSPAAERLGPALDAWAPAAPEVPFLSTTTCLVEPPERMREVLFAQLTSPVRFGDAVRAALEMGVTGFVELGPGRVLSGLVRRVDRSVPTASFGTPDDVEGLAAIGGRT
jgi:[acyl-carrier-protein] S-malonyltransferase